MTFNKIKKALKKTDRITFDFNDKSTETYKEHVQNLWNKAKELLIEDSKKNYSDEEYISLGQEIDEVWVNIQSHTSISTNEHDESVEDKSFFLNTPRVLMKPLG